MRKILTIVMIISILNTSFFPFTIHGNENMISEEEKTEECLVGEQGNTDVALLEEVSKSDDQELTDSTGHLESAPPSLAEVELNLNLEVEDLYDENSFQDIAPFVSINGSFQVDFRGNMGGGFKTIHTFFVPHGRYTIHVGYEWARNPRLPNGNEYGWLLHVNGAPATFTHTWGFETIPNLPTTGFQHTGTNYTFITTHDMSSFSWEPWTSPLTGNGIITRTNFSTPRTVDRNPDLHVPINYVFRETGEVVATDVFRPTSYNRNEVHPNPNLVPSGFVLDPPNQRETVHVGQSSVAPDIVIFYVDKTNVPLVFEPNVPEGFSYEGDVHGREYHRYRDFVNLHAESGGKTVEDHYFVGWALTGDAEPEEVVSEVLMTAGPQKTVYAVWVSSAGEPETGEAETGEPETGEPETGEPETGEPETREPETREPETREPETREPETRGLETRGPGSDGGFDEIDSSGKEDADSFQGRRLPDTGQNPNISWVIWGSLLVIMALPLVEKKRQKDH